MPLGDHVHVEIVEAEQAGHAVEINRSKHAVRLAIGRLNPHADDISDQSRRRRGLIDGDNFDSPAPGQVLDVDHVDRRVQMGLKQFHRG